jgi:hypothetical protein
MAIGTLSIETGQEFFLADLRGPGSTLLKARQKPSKALLILIGEVLIHIPQSCGNAQGKGAFDLVKIDPNLPVGAQEALGSGMKGLDLVTGSAVRGPGLPGLLPPAPGLGHDAATRISQIRANQATKELGLLQNIFLAKISRSCLRGVAHELEKGSIGDRRVGQCLRRDIGGPEAEIGLDILVDTAVRVRFLVDLQRARKEKIDIQVVENLAGMRGEAVVKLELQVRLVLDLNTTPQRDMVLPFEDLLHTLSVGAGLELGPTGTQAEAS